MRKVFYDIFIEMIAIFVGVMVAFTINNWQEGNDRKERAEKHFSMIKTELEKDLQVIEENKEKYREELELVDELIASLERNDNPSYELDCEQLGKVMFFNTKIELIESIMESNDFVVIYNQELFSALNNLKEDCKTYDYISNRVEQLKLKLEDENLAFKLSTAESKARSAAKIDLLLQKYRTEIVNKQILNLAVHSGYKIAIGELHKGL